MSERLCGHWRKIDSGKLPCGQLAVVTTAENSYIGDDIGESWASKVDAIRPLGALKASLPCGTTFLR